MHNHDMAGQMTEHSAAQSKQAYIKMMGDALGSQYAELVQDIAHLHQTWFEYVELFGKKRAGLICSMTLLRTSFAWSRTAYGKP